MIRSFFHILLLGFLIGEPLHAQELPQEISKAVKTVRERFQIRSIEVGFLVFVPEEAPQFQPLFIAVNKLTSKDRVRALAKTLSSFSDLPIAQFEIARDALSHLQSLPALEKTQLYDDGLPFEFLLALDTWAERFRKLPKTHSSQRGIDAFRLALENWEQEFQSWQSSLQNQIAGEDLTGFSPSLLRILICQLAQDSQKQNRQIFQPNRLLEKLGRLSVPLPADMNPEVFGLYEKILALLKTYDRGSALHTRAVWHDPAAFDKVLEDLDTLWKLNEIRNPSPELISRLLEKLCNPDLSRPQARNLSKTLLTLVHAYQPETPLHSLAEEPQASKIRAAIDALESRISLLKKIEHIGTRRNGYAAAQNEIRELRPVVEAFKRILEMPGTAEGEPKRDCMIDLLISGFSAAPAEK